MGISRGSPSKSCDTIAPDGDRTLPSAPMARTLRWTYTTWGEVATETDANAGTTTHVYDDFGRREHSTSPASIERRWTFDANGNVETETDGRGLVTAYEYDALNRRTQQLDPAPEGTTQTWTYDAANNIVEHVDRASETTAFTYDGENRETSRTRSGGQLTIQVEQRTYDANGNLASVTDALNRRTTYTYDQADRKKTETRPLSFVRTWTYHPWGGIATSTDADGHATTYTYDERQRLKTETDALGQVTTHGYDAAGNRTSTQRPGNTGDAQWRYGYDAANRLESVTTPTGARTDYGYDAHGNRTSITDAKRHTTTFGFDADHRLTSTTLADGTTWTYALDGNGNRQRIEVAGRRVDITYDALNRERTRTYTAGSSDDTSAHNPSAETTSYDGNGRITNQVQQRPDGTTNQSRAWDALNRLISETDFNGRQSTWRYDDTGNRQKRADEAGDTLFEADTLNRIVSLKPQAHAGFVATDITLGYTPEGRLAQIVQPNGAKSVYGYDEIGRLKTLTHEQNSQQVAQYVFEYDANGNRERETLTTGSGASAEVRITEYGYDADDRLTSIDSPESETTYTLDDVGNRETEKVREKPGNALIHDISYEYDERDRLERTEDAVTGVVTTYTYDVYGNLASKSESGATTNYRHNAQDRLATLHVQGAPPSTATTYRYGPDGLRTEKSSTGAATKFRYDQGQLRLETNAIGNVVNAYEFAAGHFVSQRSSTGSEQLHFLHDAQRSPVRVIRRDGALAGSARFDAWGNRIESTGVQSAIGYTGYYSDAESGLNYAQQRYQFPAVGRFLQVDPWKGDLQRPVTLNKYMYANSNPVIYVDPTGRGAEASHYYVPYYVARSVGYSYEEAEILALYSQLPDEVGEYDAIARSIAHVGETAQLATVVGYNYFRGVLGYAERQLEIPEGRGLADLLPQARMERESFALDKIHRGVHVLNGELAIDTQYAVSKVMRSAPTLESRGVALHGYGDAYHHASLWSKDRAEMSAPFVGHLLSWDHPDKVHVDLSQFRAYTEALTRDLAAAGGFKITEEDVARISSEVSDIASTATVVLEDRGRGQIDPLIPFRIKRDSIGYTDPEALFIKLLRDQTRERFGEAPSLRPEEYSPGYLDGPAEARENIRGLLESWGGEPTDDEVREVNNRLREGVRYAADANEMEMERRKIARMPLE